MFTNHIMETEQSIHLSQSVSDDIDKWTRWKSKNSSNVILVRSNDNTLYFQIDTKSFTVTFPKDYPNKSSMLMIESTDSIPWINKAMNFAIRKNPSIFVLLKFIEKEQRLERVK